MNFDETAYIPPADNNFVPNGNYEDVKTVVSDETIFLPTLLTGPTGAGKTKMVEQIHSTVQKPLMRVNITIESDEDSLMGGMRLKDGATYFAKGPIVQAMEMGATLLLDEVDLGNPMKLMCLQSVLDGAGYTIKKTGESIRPKPGFSIIATANTKGSGDEDGQYVGTQTLNGAMMDRFSLVFECAYPDRVTEKKILSKMRDSIQSKITDREVDALLTWAHSVRMPEESGVSLDYSISTRRLVDIVKIHKLFPVLKTAVSMSLNRFDSHHKEAFMEMFTSVLPSDNDSSGGPTANSSDPFQRSKQVRF